MDETDHTVVGDDLRLDAPVGEQVGEQVEGAVAPPAPDHVELPSDAMLGTVLDSKFLLEKPLGRGGAGRVYVGRQLSLGRVVAVKVMRPELDPEGEQRFGERFFREASLAGALNHPNVVTVHDFGRTREGLCYIVMELLAGVSLKDLLRRGPVPAERAVVIFEQIVRGLRHAHKAGLVHRDVKPGNVQVLPGDDGRDFVKLLDFGLVKGEEEESGITQHGSFIGTPHYAAPEQVKGEVATGRSDIYSTGVMLYRALTGKLPFAFDNPMAIALAHVKEPYPRMSERAPEVSVPHDLEQIVRRCMEKEPTRRYLDADALLTDIVAARRNLFPEMPSIVGTAAMVAALGGAAGGSPSKALVAPLEEPPTKPMMHPPRLAGLRSPAVGAEATGGPQGRRLAGGVLAGVALIGVALLGLCAGGGGWLLFGRAPGADPAPMAEELAVAELSPEGAAVNDTLASPPPAAPLERMVNLQVYSIPSGAEVRLDARLLGTTPLSTRVPIPGGESGAHRPIELRLAGYETKNLLVDVSGEEAKAEAALVTVRGPSTEPRTGKAPGAAPAREESSGAAERATSRSAPVAQSSGGGQIVADGVLFTPAEAAAAVQLVNGATKEALLGTGIAPTQANVILRSRPWNDVVAFAATPGIGEKTVAAVQRAVKSP